MVNRTREALWEARVVNKMKEAWWEIRGDE